MKDRLWFLAPVTEQSVEQEGVPHSMLDFREDYVRLKARELESLRLKLVA
jgi:hypothetical protein